MSSFTVELSQQAASYFKRLDKNLQNRVATKLQELCAEAEKMDVDSAFSASSTRLVNRGGARRARVGDLRIFFDVNKEFRRLQVAAILPRGDVYKHTKK